jgi:hypothetical protein
VESDLKRFREGQQLGNDQAYAAWLVSQGVTDADLRRDITTYAKLQMLGEKDLKYTDADLQRYYQQNKKRYDEPERVAFAEIVVRTQQEANEVYAMASKPGAKFPDLAKEYSIMPSRTEGGQRPLMGKEDIIPVEARTRAFAMAVGQVSQPFRSGPQWWIIKVTDRRAAKQLGFAEAKQHVESDYKLEHMVQPGEGGDKGPQVRGAPEAVHGIERVAQCARRWGSRRRGSTGPVTPRTTGAAGTGST